jgi:hypothetical protein
LAVSLRLAAFLLLYKKHNKPVLGYTISVLSEWYSMFFNEKQNYEVFSLGSLATAAQNKNVNSATLQRCGSFYAAFQTLGSSVAHSMQRVRSNIIF